MDLTRRGAELEGWIPIRVSFRDSMPVVDWCYMGDAPFTDPFFDQTVERRLRRPFPLLFRRETSMAEVEALAAERSPAEPAGFIFHASRCGSTLASQMLAALPATRVLSEPPPVDTVLRAPFSIDLAPDTLVSWLRSMILVLGSAGGPDAGDRGCIVKFDSWSAIDLPVVRRAFPDVPWLFLYNDPAEIIASQMVRRGAQMIPGLLPPQLVGLDPAAAVSLAPEEYCAHVLAAIFAAALEAYEAAPDRCLVAHYRRLPDLVSDTVAAMFSLDLDASDRSVLREVATRDAKNPEVPYQGGRQTPPSPAATRAADRLTGLLYEQLEALR